MPKKDRIDDTTHLEKKRLSQWIILDPFFTLRGPSWTLRWLCDARVRPRVRHARQAGRGDTPFSVVDGDDTTPSSSLASLFLSIDDPLLSGGHRFVRGQSDGV
jgi:hypothetical protein